MFAIVYQLNEQMDSQNIITIFRDFYDNNSNFSKTIRKAIRIAYCNNQLDIVFFIAQMCPIDDVISTIVDIACANYNSKALMSTIEKYKLKFSDDIGYKCLTNILHRACKKRDIEMLNWLVTGTEMGSHLKNESQECDITKAFESACISKNYDVVKWILENACGPHYGIDNFPYIFYVPSVQ